MTKLIFRKPPPSWCVGRQERSSALKAKQRHESCVHLMAPLLSLIHCAPVLKCQSAEPSIFKGIASASFAATM